MRNGKIERGRAGSPLPTTPARSGAHGSDAPYQKICVNLRNLRTMNLLESFNEKYVCCYLFSRSSSRPVEAHARTTILGRARCVYRSTGRGWFHLDGRPFSRSRQPAARRAFDRQRARGKRGRIKAEERSLVSARHSQTGEHQALGNFYRREEIDPTRI